MESSKESLRKLMPGIPVTLNLGLSGSTLGGRLTVAHRIRIYQRMLRQVMRSGWESDLQIVPRHVYGGEPVLVVNGMFNETVNASTLVWDSVLEAEQDCIALFYECGRFSYSGARGYLFGPRAGIWGEFNVNFFNFIGDTDE